MNNRYRYEFQLKLDIRDESIPLYIISNEDSETAQLKFNDFLVDRYNIRHLKPLPSCIKRNISDERRIKESIDDISDEEFYTSAYSDYNDNNNNDFNFKVGKNMDKVREITEDEEDDITKDKFYMDAYSDYRVMLD